MHAVIPRNMHVSVRSVLLYILMTLGAVAYAENAAVDTKPLPIRTPQPEYPADLRAPRLSSYE